MITDLSITPLAWTQAEAIALCEQIEKVCPQAGCHVALTGGCLYKSQIGAPRKDLDILFYRVRQVERIDRDLLFELLNTLGIHQLPNAITNGWIVKCKHSGRNVDVFFPESDDNSKY